MDKDIMNIIATKEDLKEFGIKRGFAEFRNENLTHLDEMMTILKRLDEERLFTFEAVKRIEAQVKTNQEEIGRIKQMLHIG